MRSERVVTLVAFLVAALVCLGCNRTVRPFPLADPIWVDDDERPVHTMPRVRPFEVASWDSVDQTFFLPATRFLAAAPRSEAVNVNALDEVPDSSWFVNRLGRGDMTAEEFARGACEEGASDPPAPWTIVSGKPAGSQPGFVIRAGDGRRYVMKFDGTLQPERATAADAVGAIIYHAVGYWAPCNRVVHFPHSILRLAPGAVRVDDLGTEMPMTWAHVEEALSKATHMSDGSIRGVASLYVPGEPLGPWDYEGKRRDDLNDVFRHEDRRELRASLLLAAWLNRFESRSENTLATWIDAGDGRGFVRHWHLDFGDCLGELWSRKAVARRFGLSYYLDFRFLFGDLLGLGIIKRPWDDVSLGPAGKIFGYWNVEKFKPKKWRPAYPNLAFRRMTLRDAAWMARILAFVGDAELDALVAAARFTNPLHASEMKRILSGRRDAILREWLEVVSPLTHPRVIPADGGNTLVCLVDTAVVSGLHKAADRRYSARTWVLDDPRAPPEAEATGDGHHGVCVRLPPVKAASRTEPRYVVIDVFAGPAYEGYVPARVHLYHLGGTDVRLVGLERPYDAKPPLK